MDVRSKYLLLEEVGKCNLPDMFKGILRDFLNGKPIPEESLLVTQQEAYTLLALGRTSFYNLEKVGVVTPVQIGDIKRYKRSDIRAIANGEAPTKKKAVAKKKTVAKKKGVAKKDVTSRQMADAPKREKDLLVAEPKKYHIDIDALLKNLNLLSSG